MVWTPAVSLEDYQLSVTMIRTIGQPSAVGNPVQMRQCAGIVTGISLYLATKQVLRWEVEMVTLSSQGYFSETLPHDQNVFRGQSSESSSFVHVRLWLQLRYTLLTARNFQMCVGFAFERSAQKCAVGIITVFQDKSALSFLLTRTATLFRRQADSSEL